MNSHEFLEQYTKELDNILQKSAGASSFIRSVLRKAPVKKPIGRKPIGAPVVNTGVGTLRPAPIKPGTFNPPKNQVVSAAKPVQKAAPVTSDRFANKITNPNVSSWKILPQAASRALWNKAYTLFAEPWTGAAKLMGRVPGLSKVRKAMDVIDTSVGKKFTTGQYNALADRYGNWGKLFNTADKWTTAGLRWGSRAAVGNYVLGNVFPNAYVGDRNSDAGSLQTSIMQGINKPLSKINEWLGVPINGTRTRLTPMSLAFDMFKDRFINENSADIDNIQNGIAAKNVRQVQDGVRHLISTNPIANWMYRNHVKAVNNDPFNYGVHMLTLDGYSIPDVPRAKFQTVLNAIHPDYQDRNATLLGDKAIANLQSIEQKFPGTMDNGIGRVKNYLNDTNRVQADVDNLGKLITNHSGTITNKINGLNSQLNNINSSINAIGNHR